MRITFFDIPSRLPQKAWSPNTWKTRYCLNFKGLAYQTEWIEYPDIEAHCVAHGIPPTTSKKVPDGRGGTKNVPAYTLPAIHDPSTNTSLSNSFDIAGYLDKTYPNKPHIFPHNTAGIQAPFARAFALNMEPVFNFLIPDECAALNPRSQEYFRTTREELFRVERLEDLKPTGDRRVAEWAKVKLGLDRTAAWFKQVEEDNGPFIMGATPCWADFVVGGYMTWARAVWGEQSEEWADIASWNDGRWKRFVEGLKKYEEIK